MKLCFVLIGAAVVLEYSYHQLLAGKTDASTTLGAVENQLASLNGILGSTVRVSYILGAAGAYCAWKHR